MEIVKLNILDGRGEIPVAVGSLVEAERLRKFMKDATGSFDFQSIWDEREACAMVAENFDFNDRQEIEPPRNLPRYVAAAIRKRSNAK